MTMTIVVGNTADTQPPNVSAQLECVDCMDDDFETLAERSRVMKWEINRRETFKTWPAWSCQRPECLAKAGFYYTKISDRVQCPFCLGVLKKWETWDEPMSEHRRHFPHCKFIQGEDVGNVPIEDNARLLQKQVSPARVGSEATVIGHIWEKNASESEKDQLSSAQENKASPVDNIPKLWPSEAVTVQAVLQMGFSQQLVQEVLRKYSISGKGKCFSALDLATDILDLEKTLETTNAISQTTASTERTQGNRIQTSKTESRRSCGLQNNSTSNQTGPGKSPLVENVKDQNSRMKDRYLCKICMETPVRVTFMPCGHLACCGPCSMAMSSCPICRTPIQERVRTYF